MPIRKNSELKLLDLHEYVIIEDINRKNSDLL